MDIELIAPTIAAYQIPKPPEAIWYISADKLTLGIAYPLEALTQTAKVLLDINWLPNRALLIIVWTAQCSEELTDLLVDVASDCGIPINIKIDP